MRRFTPAYVVPILFALATLAPIPLLAEAPLTPPRAAELSLRTPPPIREGVAAMPLIAEPATDAQRRINAALQQLDGKLRKALAACRNETGGGTDWSRAVKATMSGPAYLSLVITDDHYCGGAHPDVTTMAIVYDVGSGAPVDWKRLLPPALTGKVALATGADETKMVTLASKRLFALFLAGYAFKGETVEVESQCNDAIRDSGEGEAPAMMAWIDPTGLVVQFDLPHAVQVCAVPVTIPLATLRNEGVGGPLIEGIKAARGQ